MTFTLLHVTNYLLLTLPQFPLKNKKNPPFKARGVGMELHLNWQSFCQALYCFIL